MLTNYGRESVKLVNGFWKKQLGSLEFLKNSKVYTLQQVYHQLLCMHILYKYMEKYLYMSRKR